MSEDLQANNNLTSNEFTSHILSELSCKDSTLDEISEHSVNSSSSSDNLNPFDFSGIHILKHINKLTRV
jgi:hypothetical protein